MKKLWLTIAGLFTCVCLCFGFAACGESADDEKGDGSQDGGSQGGSAFTLEAKDIVGEEVTAEQWEAAVNAYQEDDAYKTGDLKVTVLYRATTGGDSSMGPSQSVQTEIRYVVNGTKTSTKSYQKIGSVSRDVFEIYGEMIDAANGIAEFTNKNEAGKFEKTRENVSIIGSDVQSVFKLVSTYDSYEFNAELKGYVKKDSTLVETDGKVGYQVVKFQDGKLVAIYEHHTERGEQMGMVASMTADLSWKFTYDAEEITIPIAEIDNTTDNEQVEK